MMNFVRFPQGQQILILNILKPLEPLVNKHIMNQKIGNAIKQYTQTNKEQIVDRWAYTEI
jgi:hypothetical protein|tara:strand:+ start:180 stop:359 length:180 start_codon:yes stop_codon:yes gene_type:complete